MPLARVQGRVHPDTNSQLLVHTPAHALRRSQRRRAVLECVPVLLGRRWYSPNLAPLPRYHQMRT